MTEVEVAVTAVTEEALHCFVCDVAVSGKHYTLATCRTQSTNIRLIEKLGQLVGERYMVVICEDDIICRGCANLINTLDRLETEMDSVRKVVLRFLEKKYSLEEGELINNKATTYGVPPQITPRNMSPRSVMSENFMYQKRKAALSELENENNFGISDKSKKSNSKNDVWMQCDKCKYTTHYNAFMIHHVRQHVKKKKNSACDQCGAEVTDGKCSQNCSANKDTATFTATSSEMKADHRVQESDANSRNQNSKTPAIIRKRSNPEAETVEMIAAEISEFTGVNGRSELVLTSVHETSHNANITDIGGTNKLLTECENSQQNTNCVNSQGESVATSLVRNEEMIIPVTEMTHEQVQQQLAAGNIEVQMDGQDGSAPTAICVMEMSEDHTPESTLVTVQKMEDDNNAVYVQVVEVGKDGDVDETSNIPKVLTVSDDGTVEMVEVMWDDIVPTEVESGQSLQF